MPASKNPVLSSSVEHGRQLARAGVRECDRQNYAEALRLLEHAARELGELCRLEPRALSAFGTALAESDYARRDEAIKCCKLAIRRKPSDPVLYRNLARVYVQADRRRFAVHTLDAGLRVDHDHPGLRTSRDEVGVRVPPVFASLARSHPLNRLFGRLRYRLSRLFGG